MVEAATGGLHGPELASLIREADALRVSSGRARHYEAELAPLRAYLTDPLPAAVPAGEQQ
jgi:hypothetical protein